MPSLKKLFSDSVIYGFSSIVGRFLNYLLVPLYTYKIAAATGGYGVITNIYAYTALILVMLTFGMETTFFYFANKSGEEPRRVFRTALSAVGSVAAAFVVLVFLFIHPLSRLMGYESHPEYLTTMAIVVALDAFQAILFAQLRYENRAWKFAILKLTFIVLNIGLNLLVFLLVPKLAGGPLTGWYDGSNVVGYVFTINLICTAAVTLGFIPELRHYRYGFDKGLLLPMLRYTWPLLLLGIMGMLNQVADKIIFRFLVPGKEGEIQLGIYGACVKIAMIMAIITQAFRYAYEPFVFGSGRGNKSKESQALVMKYFVMFTLLAFLMVVCYNDLIRYIIAPSYWEGLKAVPIVMLAEIFMGIYFNLSFWYKLTEKTYWGAILSAIGSAILIAVNIIFVPHYGYMACAFGGLAGYGSCMILSYIIGQRHYPIPYPIASIGGYFILTIVLYAASTAVHFDSIVANLLYGTLLLCVYLGVVLYNERAIVRRIIARKR